jgi:hypothetical protein
MVHGVLVLSGWVRSLEICSFFRNSKGCLVTTKIFFAEFGLKIILK